MMISNCATATFLVLGFLSCGSGSTLDEVSLLQSQFETAAAARKVEAFSETDDVGHGAYQASCPADGVCGADLPASFKITFPATDVDEGAVASPEVTEKETKDVMKQTLVEAVASKNEAVNMPEQAITTALGTILEVLACLLLVDVLRRSSCKTKAEKCGQEKPPAKASRPHNNPLLAAALAGDDRAFEANFIGNQDQLVQVDNWGCATLHYAAKGGSAYIVSRLLDLGAEVGAIDAWDETPLHIAARAGRVEACATLLRAGAKINALNAQDHTPLIVAGAACQQAACSFLIEHGANAGGLSDTEVPGIVSNLLMQKVLLGAPGLSQSDMSRA